MDSVSPPEFAAGQLDYGAHCARYLLHGPEDGARWSPGSVWLTAPVVWMIRGVLSPVSVALVDR